MVSKPVLSILQAALVLLLVLGYHQEMVCAASPWLWDKVLKQEKDTDAMITPTALFIDEQKELYYVVDSGRNRLLSFSRKGELLNIFNAGKSLSIPFDMVKTDNNGLWVVEKGRNSLSYIDLNKKNTSPKTLSYKGKQVYPDRIETDSGLLYVLNKATGDIISYASDLSATNRFSCSTCPWGFVDFKIHEKKLWALDQAKKTVRCFNLEGQLIRTFNLGSNVSFPISLAIGPAGFIYILDRQQRNIIVFDQDGEYKYRFLEKGMARGQLSYPNEIRFDPWGGLCLVDEGNARVEIFKR
jgi:hypothetical protein